ncbi:TPA: Gfo/Idh/MocA family protein [Legionella feeleii]
MIRLGIIGCGDIVNRYKGFSSESLRAKGLEVTALVDVNLERARKMANYFANPLLATSFDEQVIAATDAILIAAPNHLHHYYGKRCLEAGKHVLMEKPLALTQIECEELIAISKRKNLVLMVALCMRFHPLLQQFKSLLDKQQCGDLFQLSIWTEQHTEFPQDHWHNQQETLGGGQLFSHGCHYIDLLMWFLGQPVEGFFLGTNKETPWMEKEGTTNVCLKFPDNSLGYYFGTWGARGTRNDYLMQAHGSKGMLEADFNKSAITLYSKGSTKDTKQFYTGFTKEELLFKGEVDISEMYHNEMLHFLTCITTNQKPLTDATVALQSMQLIWRLYQNGFLQSGREHT